MNPSLIRMLFVGGVAFLAAVLGDALVEGLSNAHILWHGNYTDKSSVDLLPTFAIALVAMLATLRMILNECVNLAGGSTRALWASTSRVLRSAEIVNLLPAVVAVQIVTLFAMETIEQIAIYGHPFGGALWLGGPVSISLAIHAVLGIICAFFAASQLTRLAETILRVVACALTWFFARVNARPIFLDFSPLFSQSPQTFYLTDSGRRGPPLSFAL